MVDAIIPNWTMIMIEGVVLCIFQAIIFSVAKGYINGINETIKELNKSISNREQAEKNLEIKMLTLAREMSDQISETISKVGDKFEEKSNMLFETQDRLRIKENDDIWKAHRKLEDEVDKRFASCHDKSEKRFDKVIDTIEDCQKECCPRREVR